MQNSIYKQFWKYTIPTVAAMLVNGLYQVVDGIFIGRYVGADGLAGINVAWPVIGSILGIGMMVGVGTGALTSIKQGEQDQQGAKRVLTTGLLFLLALMPIVATILFFFADDFIRWQGAQGRVYKLGLQYLQILIVACIFSLGSIAVPFLLRNDNSPNLATILMVIGAIINIVLDYVFIAWMNWELTGAAIATALAQMVVTVLGVGYFFSSKAKLRLTFRELKVQLDAIPKIVLIGTSSFFYVRLWIYDGSSAQRVIRTIRQPAFDRRLRHFRLYRDGLLSRGGRHCQWYAAFGELQPWRTKSR